MECAKHRTHDTIERVAWMRSNSGTTLHEQGVVLIVEYVKDRARDAIGEGGLDEV